MRSGRSRLTQLLSGLLLFGLGATFGLWFEWYSGLLESLVTRAAPGPEAGAPGDLELGGLEARLRETPGDIGLGSAYRLKCVELEAHERSVLFFEELSRAHLSEPAAGLQLALAYADKIPTRTGLASFMAKGQLAQRSLEQLDAVIALRPDWWPAVFSRAMNQLHWPRALNRSEAAARDFERLIELQAAEAAGPRPHFVRAHLGLGDARAKGGDLEGARSAWEQGLVRFPESEALRLRLGLAGAEAAQAFLGTEYSLERAIDTDLGFLAREP